MSDTDKKEDENIGSFYMGRSRPPQPKSRFPHGLLTTLTLLAFAGVIWYAYPRGAEKYVDMDVPVVKADTSPIKTEPTDPGGMEVPHQDSTVFDPLEKKASGDVEKLLPTPEEPMDKAAAIQSAETPAPTPVAPAAVPAVVPTPDPSPRPQVAGNNTAEKLVPKEAEPAAPAPVKAESKDEPAVVAPKAKDYIQLGSYRDTAGAKKDWEWARKKFPDLLGKLTMKTEKVNLPGKGIYYRLQAGKLTEARAREICGVLKKSIPGGCILVKNG